MTELAAWQKDAPTLLIAVLRLLGNNRLLALEGTEELLE